MAFIHVTPGSVAPAEILMQFSGPASGTISAGNAVYFNATNGWISASGSANPCEGIAITSGTAGYGVTAVRKGLIDLGGTSLAGYSIGGTVYVHGQAGGSAFGSLDTTPMDGGTTIVGYIKPAFGGYAGGTLATDKLLYVDL